MLELTKSAFSYSWAMSLFGSQQLANLVAPADWRDPTRRADAAFYSVTQATQNQFNDLIFGGFQIRGKGVPIRAILTDEHARDLADKSLTMMHAGLGLAFAEKLMNRNTPYSPDSNIRCVLQEFVTLDKENARNGYEGAAFESLG